MTNKLVILYALLVVLLLILATFFVQFQIEMVRTIQYIPYTIHDRLVP